VRLTEWEGVGEVRLVLSEAQGAVGCGTVGRMGPTLLGLGATQVGAGVMQLEPDKAKYDAEAAQLGWL
jgi:hypothetical protein